MTQTYLKHELSVTVVKEGITIALNLPQQNRIEAKIPAKLLDNEWHTIQFVFRLGNLNLIIDRISVIIANATYNRELLTDQEIKNEAAVLILGRQYSGCLLHGPGLMFNNTDITVEGVKFGACPLAPGQCNPDSDILLRELTDHCYNFPCMHGQCISTSDGYECHCPTRYGGKNCDKDLGSPCERYPCKNGGTCEEDRIGNYKCVCPLSYVGQFCENLIESHPLCDKNPCLNNGTCRVPLNGNTYECQCTEGFTGYRCETNINDCESHPCQNNGRCIDEIDGFSCDCSSTGYTGNLCQRNIDECARNPCLNNGICFDNYGSYTCECRPGFGGDNCEQTVNECMSLPCLYGGTCTDDGKGNVKCICVKGFSGQFCEITPQCPHCPRDSECLDGRCVCKPGMTGNLRLIIDLTKKMHPLENLSHTLTIPFNLFILF